MAVQNQLARRPQNNSQMVEFDVGGKTVKLSPAIVKDYLVSGNGNVTTQEIVLFINLCKFNGLNPFLREAYLIKYGNQPATMVVGKEAVLKRAMRNPNYAGQTAGIIVEDKETGAIDRRVGTFYQAEHETIVGGWATVHVKGYQQPIEMTVAFDEYCLKKDGKPASNWAAKPATMIRKVALMQALREAFPEDLAQMYGAEETGVDDVALPAVPIEVDGETGEVISHEPPAAATPAQPENDVQNSFFDK